MLSFDSVPDNTKALFLSLAAINQQGILNDFILIGGTALSMHIKHRLSEDLDFSIGSLRLPVEKISSLMLTLKTDGHQVVDITDPSARDEFLNDGLDIENYQQDWLVDGVKLTFFTYGKNDYEIGVLKNAGYDLLNGIKIADINTIAKTKCHVLTKRIKSRDIFDVDCLIDAGALTIDNVIAEMQKSNPYMSFETAIHRITEAPIREDDEGLVSVGVSQSIEKIRERLDLKIQKFEAGVALERLSSHCPYCDASPCKCLGSP